MTVSRHSTSNSLWPSSSTLSMKISTLSKTLSVRSEYECCGLTRWCVSPSCPWFTSITASQSLPSGWRKECTTSPLSPTHSRLICYPMTSLPSKISPNVGEVSKESSVVRIFICIILIYVSILFCYLLCIHFILLSIFPLILLLLSTSDGIDE